MQTRHTSDSLFQTITNHPGSLPRLSHIPILKMEPHIGRFFSRFGEGKAADKKPEGCSTLHQLAMLPEGIVHQLGRGGRAPVASLSPPSSGS